MRYLGGKHKIAKHVVSFLESQRSDNQLYVEPFLGGASIFSRMSYPKIAGDLHSDLILMWQALQTDWKPPFSINETDYQAIKQLKPCALRGFAGFTCSFGGKFFGGYARGDGRNFCFEGRQRVLKTVFTMKNAAITQGDYTQFSYVKNAVIYCDIPYRATTSYHRSQYFNYEKFYKWCSEMSKDNKVFVSSYILPKPFTCVWSMNRNLELTSGLRTERIFTI